MLILANIAPESDTAVSLIIGGGAIMKRARQIGTNTVVDAIWLWQIPVHID